MDSQILQNTSKSPTPQTRVPVTTVIWASHSLCRCYNEGTGECVVLVPLAALQAKIHADTARAKYATTSYLFGLMTCSASTLENYWSATLSRQLVAFVIERAVFH